MPITQFFTKSSHSAARNNPAQVTDTDPVPALDEHSPQADQASPNGIGHYFRGQLQSIFTLDLRSLSMMRIGVALAVMTDLIIRYSDLRAHYTDWGVLPLEALFRFLWNPYYLSVYTIANSSLMQSLVFFVNFLCAICLLVGYRTRLFTVVCWVFLFSLHNRNPLIQQGGDDLLRMLLFWGMFLPWGYYYSVDAKRISRTSLVSNEYVSLAGFAYICQVFYVYFFSALLKIGPEWSQDYTALYYALSLEQIVSPIGLYLHQYYDLMKFLTMMVYYTELVVPFLLFLPIMNQYCRVAFVLIICGFHLGISLCMYVGLFPLINLVSVIGMIPILAQDRLQSRLSARIRDYAREKVSALLHRAQTLRQLARERAQEWLGLYDREPAAAEAVRPARVPLIPRETTFTFGVVAFFLAYTFAWNVDGLGKRVPYFEHVQWVGHMFRVDQHWGMFAPAVFKDDGWFVLLGRTVDGREVDIKHPDQPVSYAKPEVMPAFFKNDRWRKYHENILLVRNSHFRLYYCAYLTNRWNEDHANRKDWIPNLKIIYMKEVSQPDYKIPEPIKEVLFECNTTF